MPHRRPSLLCLALASVVALAPPPALAAEDTEPRVRLALFVVADGVYNSEWMAPWDVLQHSVFRDETDYVAVESVSADGGPVTTFEGLVVETDHSFATAPRPDILVIPSTVGSMDRDLEDDAYMGWVRTAAEQAEWVLTVCDGAFPLAATGLLDGRQATTFPGDRDRFGETFPDVHLRRDVRLVVDGKYVTSVGGGMSYEPAFWLVERLYGEEHARRSAQGLVWPWDPTTLPHVVVDSGAPELPVEATSLLGEPLRRPILPAPTRARLEADLERARTRHEADPADPERIVWLARRLGYLGRYREAIEVLDRGLELHPGDPRLLRHRGHRRLTVRDPEGAAADLEAARLVVAGQPDALELDGAPNSYGIPLSTLHFNIGYHLGVAHYVAGDLEEALRAFRWTWTIAQRNDDLRVATADWLVLTLRRLGRDDEAAEILAGLPEAPDLLENASYWRRLRFYRGEITAEELLGSSSDDLDIATQGYGLAAWWLAEGERERGVEMLERVVEGGSWAAFGHLAAEADLARMAGK